METDKPYAEQLFLSTPSARRATSGLFVEAVRIIKISIHALREEGDAASLVACAGVDISIHALREEGDRLHCYEVQR